MDILATLRALGPGYKLVSAAADEIERLRARAEELSHHIATMQWPGEKEVDDEIRVDVQDDEISRLRARIADLEAYVAFLEGGPMPKSQ